MELPVGQTYSYDRQPGRVFPPWCGIASLPKRTASRALSPSLTKAGGSCPPLFAKAAEKSREADFRDFGGWSPLIRGTCERRRPRQSLELRGRSPLSPQSIGTETLPDVGTHLIEVQST